MSKNENTYVKKYLQIGTIMLARRKIFCRPLIQTVFRKTFVLMEIGKQKLVSDFVIKRSL